MCLKSYDIFKLIIEIATRRLMEQYGLAVYRVVHFVHSRYLPLMDHHNHMIAIN